MLENSLISADPIQQEKDAIFLLLAFALVFRDWQPGYIPRWERRGYNVGAVLVDSQCQPVAFGLNSVSALGDATQHAELRAITRYLKQTRHFDLEGYTLYATLEPCIMCAGMMTMVSVSRVVYGQRDAAFSRAFERLAIDTRQIGGFPPYPRQVAVVESSLPVGQKLEKGFRKFQADGNKILAVYLASSEAKFIFREAYFTFLGFSIQFVENENIYQQALNYLQTAIHES